jgi:hypothetical protein
MTPAAIAGQSVVCLSLPLAVLWAHWYVYHVRTIRSLGDAGSRFVRRFTGTAAKCRVPRDAGKPVLMALTATGIAGRPGRPFLTRRFVVPLNTIDGARSLVATCHILSDAAEFTTKSGVRNYTAGTHLRA